MTKKNKIIFCGDVFLKTKNGDGPFSLVSDHFSNSSVCINLEAALKTERSAEKEKSISIFLDDSDLLSLGEHVEIVSLVNNHVHDTDAADELSSRLQAAGKFVIGPRNPSCLEISHSDGIRLAIFSAYFRLPRLLLNYENKTAKHLYKKLQTSDADIKVVNLHWGFEYVSRPSPFQRAMARRLIDLGADVIIGHHPHVPQGWETYCSKYIFYSLGNFNFSTEFGDTYEDTSWGYMVELDLISKDVKVIPYQINENWQPCCNFNESDVDLNKKLRQLCGKISNNRNNWYKEYSSWYSREQEAWRADLRTR